LQLTMFLVNWFKGLLDYLGLTNKKAKVLFLGLDNAGKTTLLRMLRDDKLIVHPPTFHPQKEELTVGGVNFEAHDLGGHPDGRKAWPSYFVDVSGIVFLVDSTDKERFPLVRDVLSQLLVQEQLQGVPFLVLGNKVDAKEAVSELRLRESVGLETTTGKGKPSGAKGKGAQTIEVFMCSIVKRAGYADGFKWLAQYL